MMCQPLCKLLGKELSYLASGEKLPTSELFTKVGTTNTIGLLFAAVPSEETVEVSVSERAANQLKDLRDSLVELHEELKKRSETCFEVVLIPMNRALCPEDSTAGIKQLFSQPEQHCPFLLISSEKAARIQEYLARKYAIQETPCLLLLNAVTAEVIRFNGKEKVLQDPKGANFPWKFPPCSEMLKCGNLIRNRKAKALVNQGKCHSRERNAAAASVAAPAVDDDERQTSASETEASADEIKTPIKGLLFAAFWCPPCRTFMTALTELYERVNDGEKKLEIIFVSSDRSQESFNRFFNTMPWLAIPYGDEELRQNLTMAFDVKAIPNLTLLDHNDRIITTEGRLEINDDLEGIEFPWYPRLVDELRDRHSSTLNNSTCVIYFTDDTDSDYEVGETILSSVATETERSSVEEAFEPKFFIAADSDLAESLRIFMDLSETRSYLIIMDAANFRYAVHEGNGAVSESSVKEFLNKFQTNKLIYRYIQSRFV